MSLLLMAFVCTLAWDTFVNGKVYYCTDGGTLDFFIGLGDWVHNPESVAQVVPRGMSEPDEIKNGWSMTGLWWLWFAFIAVSVAISALFAGMLWRVSSTNKPAAPNAGLTSQLTIGHPRPGVGEPGRRTGFQSTTRRVSLLWGAFGGLLVGIVMFTAAVAMPFFSLFDRMFEIFHWPAFALMDSLDSQFHFLGKTDANVYYFLLAILGYWLVMGFLSGLGHWILRDRGRMEHADRVVQPCASPNGGPATHLGNSEVTEGPPSVS